MREAFKSASISGARRVRCQKGKGLPSLTLPPAPAHSAGTRLQHSHGRPVPPLDAPWKPPRPAQTRPGALPEPAETLQGPSKAPTETEKERQGEARSRKVTNSKTSILAWFYKHFRPWGAPGTPPGRPKEPQRGPRDLPRTPQDTPRELQGPPRDPPGSPKDPPGTPRELQKEQKIEKECPWRSPGIRRRPPGRNSRGKT